VNAGLPRVVVFSEIGLLWLAGAQSLERFECGRLVGNVVEGPCCCLNLGERGLVSLVAEACEPPQRGALEPVRLGLADGEGVPEVDARKFSSGVPDQGEIAKS
jgi:hypothetical protein